MRGGHVTRSYAGLIPLALFVVASNGCTPNPPSPMVCTPSASDVLAVALRPQETDMWCWAASGEMVMEFHGASIRQCDEANSRFGRSDCCNTPVTGSCVVGGWPEFDKHGFRFSRTSNAALSWDVAREQINCKKRPFAFTWAWNGGGGHMMVAIGYSTVGGQRYVTVNDPWAPNVGDQRIITYDAYVSGNGYSHWDDYYDVTR